MSHNRYFGQRLQDPSIQLKLGYIEMRWGVNLDLLLKIGDSSTGLLEGLERNKKRKFKKNLGSLQSVFSHVAQRIPIVDRFADLSDPAMKDYYDFIRSSLGEADFQQYLSGDWDDRVLSVVSIAQKRYLIPRRVKSPAEQNPRVKFSPRPQYGSDWNR